MTVQTRSSYGAPLPWSVVDDNFTSLQAGVYAAAVASDLASTEVGKGAASIGISPIAGVSATSVQAAIAELANDNNALAGSGGADLIGANDSASGSIFTTVAGFISRVMSSAGASVVGFIQSGTGAVPTTVQTVLRELPVSPENFGAASTFSLTADDTTAVQKALDTGRPVRLNRLYRCTAGLTSSGQMISGSGTQTGFVFDNIGTGVNGITFTPTVAETTSGVTDCAIYVRTSNGGSAIKTPKSGTQYTLRSKFLFERLLIAGYEKPVSGANAFETTTGWAVGFDLGDAWNVEVYECDGYSTYRSDTDPSGQLQSAFIRLDAASTMLTAHIGSITASNWYRGIEIGDRAFFQIQRFDIAHTYDGVYQIGSTQPYSESKLAHGNINAQHWGVYFNGVTSREITGVVVRRHRYGWKGATYDWIGFNLSGCSAVWMASCHAQPDESSGVFTGTQYGVASKAGNALNITGFLAGSSLDYGVYADNCTMVAVDNLMTWQANGVGDVAIMFANNTRLSYVGFVTTVSSFAGVTFATSGTVATSNSIVGRNLSPEGSVPRQYWRETDQSANNVVWYDYVNNGIHGRTVQSDDGATTTNYELVTRSGTTVSQIEWRALNYKFTGVPTYADDTAAGSGGLVSGQIYKTSAGDLRIKL